MRSVFVYGLYLMGFVITCQLSTSKWIWNEYLIDYLIRYLYLISRYFCPILYGYCQCLNATGGCKVKRRPDWRKQAIDKTETIQDMDQDEFKTIVVQVKSFSR